MNDSKRSLLPALLAVGTSFTALPASALELGEINVESTLGQPLRASISYALAPNEQLANYCVTLNPRHAGNGLPTVTRADVSVANGVISLTGKSIVREPLMTVRVELACPYTPNLSREYMLFFDPSTPVKAAAPAAAAATVSQTETASRQLQPATAARPTPRPAVRRSVAASTPIDATTRYRVQPGDSLSQIAERIENRPIGLWDAVALIFDANPDAFIDNDPNKLKAGSWLDIPNFVADAQAAPEFESSADAESQPAAGSAGASAVAETPTVSETPTETRVADDTSALEPAATAAVDGLQPGDIVRDDQTPIAASGESTVVIPDTEIETTAPTAQSPNIPTARIVAPEEPAPSGTNWLLWLFGGGGAALIIGLLLFGRRNRDLGDPAVVAAETTHPMRRASDTGQAEALPDDDFIISDDSPTEENLALDADLEIGTGLQEGSDVDVRHDFAFASTTSLDLELPFEDEGDTSETDMMAAPTAEEAVILEEEILPDDDDYDMSVIVDATKMPNTEEVTERDLKAVVVDEAADDEGGYTIDQEVDYQILEQDYEEELTATQALNKEIERAAAELASRMEDPDADMSNDETEDMQLATVTELDSLRPATASDDGDAGDNEEETDEIIAEEATVEMPGDDNESTVEMPAKQGKTDTSSG